MLEVEQWAEIRRLSLVEKMSQREIVKEVGVARETVRKAIASTEPPSYGPRAKRASKLDSHLEKICELLEKTPTLSGVRIGEEIAKEGYSGGKTILDDLLRELRPRYAPPRTFQRTNYTPGELIQFDLTEPRKEIPVGWGQTRPGYILTAKLPHSRALAGALIFNKKWSDIAWGMNYCLARLGALPEKLVWDREGAIHRGGGQPTDEFAAYCRGLGVGWIILAAGDAQAKGSLERDHRFIHGNFEAGRSFAGQLDFQAQFEGWCKRVGERKHRTTKRKISEHLAEERELMRPLPEQMPRPTTPTPRPSSRR